MPTPTPMPAHPGRASQQEGRPLAIAAALVVVLAWLWVQPFAAPPAGVDLGPLPWWGGVQDVLLDGPDAGEWARNAALLAQGQVDALDHHRLPGWLVILAAGQWIAGSVAEAGHLGNRLLFLVLALGALQIGRRGGGAAVGLLAALLCLSCAPLALSAWRFGVDLPVAAFICLGLGLAAAARADWRWALGAGLIGGFTTGLHYTTLPMMGPSLLLLLLPGEMGRRGRRLGLYLLGAGLTAGALLLLWPVPSLDRFVEDLLNGISPGSRGGGQVASMDAGRGVLQADLLLALRIALADAVERSGLSWLPLSIGLLLPWLGVLGLGLAEVGPRPAAARDLPRWLWASADLGLGLVLLLALAPLPFLQAAGAPDRYADNLLPVVAVLVARGLLGPVRLVLGGGGARGAAWLPAALALLLVLPSMWVREPATQPYPPSETDIGTVLLARVLATEAPAGSQVATPIREAAFLASRGYCPTRICPLEASEAAFQTCLAVLAQECQGDGDILYVTTSARFLYDPNATARPAMDRWVAARWPAARTVRYQAFSADVHRIPRAAVQPDAVVPAYQPAFQLGGP